MADTTISGDDYVKFAAALVALSQDDFRKLDSSGSPALAKEAALAPASVCVCGGGAR
ncbi:MAG: hypothetical protein QOJ56_6020 [Mycobacterium sp.]|nr:hypothetical protein [Mycobacterium sp.]